VNFIPAPYVYQEIQLSLIIIASAVDSVEKRQQRCTRSAGMTVDDLLTVCGVPAGPSQTGDPLAEA
jgi:hypothetical protein